MAASLHEIYDSCAPSAWRRARELLGSEADAWDVVQKVFCELAQGGKAGDLERPMAYVYRATTNLCLNELAARRVRIAHGPAPVDAAAPGDRVHARELLEKLDARMDDLDRRIVVLAFHDGLPQEEIAEILGVWRRTIGRRLARLRQLAEEIERLPLKRTP